MIQIAEFACYLILMNFKNCSNYFSFSQFSLLFFLLVSIQKATEIAFSTLKDFDLKHRIIVTIFGEVCAKECPLSPHCLGRLHNTKKESDKRRIKTFFFAFALPQKTEAKRKSFSRIKT
jgi:hypothetical protein